MTLTFHTHIYSHCSCFRTRCLGGTRLPWASRRRTQWHLGFAMALVVSVIALCFTPKTEAEELGHLLYHDSDYRHWNQPGTNISCCSDHDCAPVKAELRKGKWFALRQTEWFDVPDEKGPGEWLPLRQSQWIEVPDGKIIHERNPTVEGGHLCYSNGKVICFVPPNTGG